MVWEMKGESEATWRRPKEMNPNYYLMYAFGRSWILEWLSSKIEFMPYI